MQTTTYAKRFLEGKLHRIIEVVNDPPFVVFRKAVVYLCFRQETAVTLFLALVAAAAAEIASRLALSSVIDQLVSVAKKVKNQLFYSTTRTSHVWVNLRCAQVRLCL